MYAPKRKVVPTVFWKFSGGGGMEHPYLVVRSLVITQTDNTTVEAEFSACEYDDGQNVPNRRSQEEIQRIHRECTVA